MSVSTERSELQEYKRIEKLGEGTYGIVYKCRHKGKVVALKKIKIDPHEEGIPATTLREVSLLKELKHPCIIQLTQTLYVDGNLFLVFDYIDQDLKAYLESQSKLLALRTLKRLSFMLILGMSFCHSNRILHRDLKPQNLLISREGKLLIADFGLGREHCFPIAKLTHEVVTLWYRPPEILLGSPTYGGACDVWGIGTILVEMASCRALFPGDSEIDQLFQIFRVLGTPNDSNWPGVEKLPDWKPLFPQWTKNSLREKVADTRCHLDEDGLDLIGKMLLYRPVDRITCKEALEHKWFDEVRDELTSQVTAEYNEMHGIVGKPIVAKAAKTRGHAGWTMMQGVENESSLANRVAQPARYRSKRNDPRLRVSKPRTPMDVE